MHFACRHIKADGTRCRAAALHNSHFCYYHAKNRSSARLAADEDFIIPIPEDRASICTTIAQTLNALVSKRIDPKTTGLILYGLQLAAQTLPKDITLPSDSVREITHSSEGDELAPEACIDSASDCASCPRADTCKRRVIDPDDEEDDQAQENATDSTTSQFDSWGFRMGPNGRLHMSDEHEPDQPLQRRSVSS